MFMKRKVVELVVSPKSLAEIEIPADAEFYGLLSSETSTTVSLLLGAPEGAAMVKRKLWMVPLHGEAGIEAQNGLFIGHAHVSLPVEATTKTVLFVLFLETQKQALDRATHRGGR